MSCHVIVIYTIYRNAKGQIPIYGNITLMAFTVERLSVPFPKIPLFSQRDLLIKLRASDLVVLVFCRWLIARHHFLNLSLIGLCLVLFLTFATRFSCSDEKDKKTLTTHCSFVSGNRLLHH